MKRKSKVKASKLFRVCPFGYPHEPGMFGYGGTLDYFCKYDELTGVIACPNPELPAIAETCDEDVKEGLPA